MSVVTEQGYSGDRHGPPARPSVTTRAAPSETAAQPRPHVIDVSYWLWLGACLLGMITAAAALVSFGRLEADMLALVERQFPGETPAMRAEVATAAVAIVIGAGVLVVLAQTAFAIVMHSGRGWARFALVLLALVGALYGAVIFGAAPTAAKAGLSATTVLMVIAALLMFLPAVRPWFAQRRLARSGGYEYSE
ncbi:MAG: hypothetical protein ACRDTE_31360 [Pseudonocardiaceae bacterium]